MKKRQIIASTLYTTPPPQDKKWPSVFQSAIANNATTRQRTIVPAPSAWGSVPGTATFTNFCTNCEASTGAPGAFTVVNTKDVLSMQALKPIGSTRVIS